MVDEALSQALRCSEVFFHDKFDEGLDVKEVLLRIENNL